ncbi:hypothetical protein V5F59_17140 [Xanthobacter autotrophicus DSM 431]|uniref:hypothetical protein n=1 Tax=Xanthobacter nonsaccharivorans TaxID=3119912 RepID=UPI003729130E
MASTELQNIGRTLLELAGPGLTAKQLFNAVKARHPQAKRKEITRAALAMMIDAAGADTTKAYQLHALAISQRATAGDEE